MGASTVKVATYYELVVRKKVGCRSTKSIKKRSYVGVGDIRGDVHISNNNMIEFRQTWGLTFNGESFNRIYVI